MRAIQRAVEALSALGPLADSLKILTGSGALGAEAAAAAAVDDAQEAPVVRNERKVGRNEPCPCGSGKKYKQCHGQLE